MKHNKLTRGGRQQDQTRTVSSGLQRKLCMVLIHGRSLRHIAPDEGSLAKDPGVSPVRRAPQELNSQISSLALENATWIIDLAMFFTVSRVL